MSARSSEVRKKYEKCMKRMKHKKIQGSLCTEGRCSAEARYKSFPSAYANGHGVQVCQGRIRTPDGSRVTSKKSRSKTSLRQRSAKRTKKSRGLARWYKEKWVNACDPSHPPCGRPRGTDPRSGHDPRFPYCRPTVRVTAKTPQILSKLSADTLAKRCRRKQRSPSTRVLASKSSYRGVGSADPRWMTYRDAHAYEEEARERGVSEVARSARGFMRAYERHKTADRTRRAVANASTGLTWGTKRSNFVRRHMAQYTRHPTRRRWLALVMWAYRPPGEAPAK